MKIEHSGKYVKIADTLFLMDSASRGYPFIKDTSQFKVLTRDQNLSLYPARIIIEKNQAWYLSYLNISRELNSISFSCIVNLQLEYDRFKKGYPKH